MVLKRVLAEHMVIGNHDNVISYVKLGPKALDFLQGRLKVRDIICFNTCFIGRAISGKQSFWYLTTYISGDYHINTYCFTVNGWLFVKKC